MSVIFDSKSNSFKLDTPNTSYIIQIAKGGYILHRYYGATIDDTDLSYLDQKTVYGSFHPKSPDTGRQLESSMLDR